MTTSNSGKQDGLYKPRATRPEWLYSGDKPNQQLRSFVEAHLRVRPYDPKTDSYSVPAFNKPIETTKATAIYNMHTYWSKKPHDAIRQYIRHYTEAGDLVLDPFCGSGGTALAALMEGRDAIAIDRSPAATFITKNYCAPVDVLELQKAFQQLKLEVADEIEWLYETRCDQCDGQAVTTATVYSQVFQCIRCMKDVTLFDGIDATGRTAKGDAKKIKACPFCFPQGFIEEIDTKRQRVGAVPVSVTYKCKARCQEVRQRLHNDPSKKRAEYFDKYDLAKIQEIESIEIPHVYPQTRMMHVAEDQECWGVKWRAGTSSFRTVDQLFTKRNLWALATYYEAAKECDNTTARDSFQFGLNSILLAMSLMQGYTEDPRFPNQLMRGTYYTPPVGREYNVSIWLDGKLANLVSGYSKINQEIDSSQVIVSTESAVKLDRIPAESVDYIFTDPPYSGTQQYGELNFVWEAWLGFDTHWHDEEIIVNEVRKKSEADWAQMMSQAMAECYRTLKPGRWLSLCYHDTSEGTWALIQDIMAEVGFLVDKSDSALFISAKQKSFNQLTADKVNKRDLVINFRKPKPGETAAALTITGEEDQMSFTHKVHTIIHDYLTANPGSPKDRIYDEVVSRMVRAGRMEAHDFEDLLAQVAEQVREPIRKDLFENEDPNLFGTHEIGRWYLKDTEMVIVDSAESSKEDAAAESIKTFIKSHLAKYLGSEGVHYSDIFEYFVYTVHDKPRRPLAEWLLDYFYKTDLGTYRLPASEEEEQLKKLGRASGINRRIKRYISYLQQGVAVPHKERPSDWTLAEWLRNAKRSGMYEAGKLLYEKGGMSLDNLPEELSVQVEEDYQVCTRMFARIGDQPRVAKPRRSKRK